MIDKKVSDRIGLIILLYFALKPLYLTSSGTMQIADIVLIIGLAWIIVSNKGLLVFGSERAKKFILFFATLVVFQAGDNFVWSIITGDSGINHRTLYYIFNLLAFSVCLIVGNQIGIQQLRRYLINGCFISTFITALGLIVSPTGRTRSTSFFNNPNQLGYYAVLVLTVVVLCDEYISKWKKTVLIALSFLFTVVSLSKAAILAYFIMVFLYILFRKEKSSRWHFIFQVFLLLILGFVIYLIFYSDSNLIISNPTLLEMRNRILFMQDEGDSNFADGRGYARIFEIGTNFIWGMGEGANERFMYRHGSEVHSTLVSLFTCYGLLGLSGYLYIFKACLGKKQQLFKNAIVLSGPFLYSLTHNGIRNTLLWLLLAVMFVENLESDMMDNMPDTGVILH